MPTATTNALIEVRGLSMDFGEGSVLDALELDLEAGAMVGLVGPNGAGKSTLLALLMGLLRPRGGEVRLRGRSLAAFSRRQLARSLALVPQVIETGFPFRVHEIVTMGRYPYLGRFQAPGPADIAAVQAAMAATEVTHLACRPIDALSGGERQRVLIARAIAQQTPVILLDEVTANLDLSHQLEVLELARALAADGRLVIAALHDLALAARYCDRLLLLADARIQADGPPAAVLTVDNLRRCFKVEARIEPLADGPGLMITPLRAVPGG